MIRIQKNDDKIYLPTLLCEFPLQFSLPTYCCWHSFRLPFPLSCCLKNLLKAHKISLSIEAFLLRVIFPRVWCTTIFYPVRLLLTYLRILSRFSSLLWVVRIVLVVVRLLMLRSVVATVMMIALAIPPIPWRYSMIATSFTPGNLVIRWFISVISAVTVSTTWRRTMVSVGWLIAIVPASTVLLLMIILSISILHNDNLWFYHTVCWDLI